MVDVILGLLRAGKRQTGWFSCFPSFIGVFITMKSEYLFPFLFSEEEGGMWIILVESLMECLPAQGLSRGRSWREMRADSGFKKECLVGN